MATRLRGRFGWGRSALCMVLSVGLVLPSLPLSAYAETPTEEEAVADEVLPSDEAANDLSDVGLVETEASGDEDAPSVASAVSDEQEPDEDPITDAELAGGLLADGITMGLPADVDFSCEDLDVLVAQQDSAEDGISNLRVTVSYGQTEARKMHAMINSFRTGSEAWHYNEAGKKVQDKNLAKLTYDYDLERVAMQRAAEIALLFSHTRPDRTSCFTAYPDKFSRMGENIAAGYQSVSAVMEGWKETNEGYSGQGHRRNMLGSGFNAVGVGHVVHNGMHFWVQEFGYTNSLNTKATSAKDGATSVGVPVYTKAVGLIDRWTISPSSIHLEARGQTAKAPTVTLPRSIHMLNSNMNSLFYFSATIDEVWASKDESVASVVDGTVRATTERGSTLITLPSWNGSLEVAVDVYPFRDIVGSTSHLDDILWLYDEHISTGWTQGGYRYFRTSDAVKRGDMAAFLYRLASSWGLVGKNWQPSDDAVIRFSDVSSATSHCNEIWWLAEMGISTGWEESDGSCTFRPNKAVKRGDMAAFIARLARIAKRGSSIVENPNAFVDVSSATAHARDIQWLAATGISAGWKVTGGAEYRPTTDVKRGDMAAFLHRLDQLG